MKYFISALFLFAALCAHSDNVIPCPALNEQVLVFSTYFQNGFSLEFML